MAADYDILGLAIERAIAQEFPDADFQMITDYVVIVGGAVLREDGQVVSQVCTLVPDDQLLYRTHGLVGYVHARHLALIGEAQ